MSFEITDTTSLILQNSLAEATKNAERSMIRLSHGEQTEAVENAANMLIAEGMESERRGAIQAAQNVQTGLNMLSTAESGLSSMSDNVQRIRELALQRENDTLGDEGKAAIDSEIDQLTQEIDRVAKSTSFSDQKLLDGSSSELTLQIGAGSDPDTNSLKVGDSMGAVSSSGLGLDRNAPDFIDRLDNALSTINSRRSEIGAMSGRLESAVSSLQVQTENITASQSLIRDVDIATEVSNLTQNQILQDASGSLLVQANQSASIANLLI